MIKSLLIVAAFGMGTAAIAQNSGVAGTGAQSSATTPQAMPDNSANTTASAPAGVSSNMSTSNAPAATDPSANGTPTAMMANTDTSAYPACSATVTDKCVQRGASHRRHM